MYKEALNGIIHNSQSLQTTQTPSIRQWKNKLWCVHTVKHNSVIKEKKKLQIYTTNAVDLENIMLSEGSQMQESIFYMTQLT